MTTVHVLQEKAEEPVLEHKAKPELWFNTLKAVSKFLNNQD